MIDQRRHAKTSAGVRYHRLGVAALEEERMEDAVAALRMAVESDPTLERAWNDLGVVMEALGNPHEALKCYRNALAVKPAQTEAQSNLGMLILQLQLAQAERRQAFNSRPSY